MSENAVTRIAMWSGPRNISTALMRAFENRTDCAVVDEPLYAYYLAETGLEHPGRDLVLESQPRQAEAALEALFAPLPEGITLQYQKHMSHHILGDTPIDWLDRVVNCFLLRDPRAMVASYVLTRKTITPDQMGLRQLADIFDRALAEGRDPVVVDSDDLLQNPEGMLRALCDRLGIPFSDKMLSWPPGRRDTDGAWAPWWYKRVEASTGFEPRAAFSGSLSEEYEAIAAALMPYHQHLAAHKIRL